MNFRALDRFNLILHGQSSGLELLGSDTFAHSFNSDSIITEGERCTLYAAADGYWDCTALSTRPFNSTRSEIGSKSGKEGRNGGR